MKTNQQNTLSKAVAILGCAALASTSLHAATVYNVNIGAAGSGATNEITTGDNFVGAAAENTVNSTWNVVTAAASGQALVDSTGAASAITIDVTANTPFTDVRDIGAGDDEIFTTYIGGAGQASIPSTFTFNNLDNTATYDLVIYSDWGWTGGADDLLVTQTTGTGLTGNLHINHDDSLDLDVSPLTQDTNAADVAASANWYRITGLTADSGTLAFNASNNAPLNGLQLIAVPEPSSALLGVLGLSFLAVRRRR